MNFNFNETYKNEFITELNEFKFKKNYYKNKIRIDGYSKNIINEINYNYNLESNLEYILLNSYFITITYSYKNLLFKNSKLSQLNSPITSSNADLSALLVYEFRDYYNRFTRKFTNDRNFMTLKPHKDRPITYGFLDAEGTRWGTFKNEYNNIHLHALMVIPENKHLEFKNCNNAFFKNPKNQSHFSFDSVDIQKVYDYGLGLDTVPYLLTYASKFIPQNAKQLICKVDQEFLPRYSNGNLDFYH
ncbi:hypothetical protein [Bartonella sp. HY761]|uniref:hypothetical protein n=1 Tax=Bartonella sp. HY761 TaxID=2979330 RepID=UPI00220EBDF6|nr:hypothetical protein [Bartonella sp. HY761]UXN05415.1 hypothetical protein N6A79_08840 [Bartonella sp. HY761]